MNRYNRNPLDGPIYGWGGGGGLESCDRNVLGESVSYTQDESHSGGTTYPTVTLLSTLMSQR